ncbi:MAG TPA: hypothetical protein P5085_07100, partial [Paludibacteraceae bacterium]|nr:hypothetical protein [Paludibacteraceae bacterium]
QQYQNRLISLSEECNGQVPQAVRKWTYKKYFFTKILLFFYKLIFLQASHKRQKLEKNLSNFCR